MRKHPARKKIEGRRIRSHEKGNIPRDQEGKSTDRDVEILIEDVHLDPCQWAQTVKQIRENSNERRNHDEHVSKPDHSQKGFIPINLSKY